MVVPLLYKFSSQIINLSFGINHNYYVGWGIASDSDDNVQINNYHREKILTFWVFRAHYQNR